MHGPWHMPEHPDEHYGDPCSYELDQLELYEAHLYGACPDLDELEDDHEA